jgi:HEAT repeats
MFYRSRLLIATCVTGLVISCLPIGRAVGQSQQPAANRADRSDWSAVWAGIGGLAIGGGLATVLLLGRKSSRKPLMRRDLSLSSLDGDRSLPAEITETTRLTKVDSGLALMAELHSLDPVKRCKAIWDLGQCGDSRAIQPLVDLLMDSDSAQRSLILAAVSEIGVRSLKPLTRGLMLSIQDDSPDVRKNAIRDVTRLCDGVAQVSQILQYAADDADPEVQETAQWALNQLSRMRSLPDSDLLNSAISAPEEPS